MTESGVSCFVQTRSVGLCQDLNLRLYKFAVASSVHNTLDGTGIEKKLYKEISKSQYD